MSIKIKQNDSFPPFCCTLLSTSPIDLTTAIAINFVWRLHGSSDRHVGTMTLVDAPTNKVQYNWGGTSTGTAGTFDCQVEVTFPGGVMTFPNDGYFTLIVTPTI